MTQICGAKKSIALFGGNPQMVLSLRQLNRYSGPILKIRRSSDNTTQLFYFSGIKYGINEDEILDFVGGGNGFVETWYDQSGNNLHATNTTLEQQPRIVNSGIIDKINNRPTLIFSGQQQLNVGTTIFGQSFGVFQRTNFQMVVTQTVGQSQFRGVFPGSVDDAFWTHSDYSRNGSSLRNITTNGNNPITDVVGSSLFQVCGFGTPDGAATITRPHTIGFATSSYVSLTGSLSELIIFPTDIREKRQYISENQMEFFNIIS